jgi:hypothetical protein
VKENVSTYTRNIKPTNPIEHSSSSQTDSHLWRPKFPDNFNSSEEIWFGKHQNKEKRAKLQPNPGSISLCKSGWGASTYKASKDFNIPYKVLHKHLEGTNEDRKVNL